MWFVIETGDVLEGRKREVSGEDEGSRGWEVGEVLGSFGVLKLVTIGSLTVRWCYESKVPSQ